MLFNVPNTPAFNIIEYLFGDLKREVRSKNKDKASLLIDEARHFLRNDVNEAYIKKL